MYTAADLPSRPAGDWLGPLPRHHGEVREVTITDVGATIDGSADAGATRTFPMVAYDRFGNLFVSYLLDEPGLAD